MQQMMLEHYLQGWKEQRPQFIQATKDELERQHEEADGLTEQVLTSGSDQEYEEWAYWLHTLVANAIENEIKRLGDSN